MIEQVNQVGLVEIYGGRKREIKVELDRNKLKAREISASQVSERLKISGQNIPAGKISGENSDTVFRTLGEYKTIKEIESTIVNFLGNDVPITVKDVGSVKDSLEERKLTLITMVSLQSYFLFTNNQDQTRLVLLKVLKSK